MRFGMSRGRISFVFFSLLLALCAMPLSCGDGSPDVVTIKLPADMVEECWGECPVPEGFEVVWEGVDVMANRLLLGKYASGDYRLRVSKSGKNVLTETDMREIVFDSEYNLFKIHKTGIVTVTISDGNYTGSNSVAHQLPISYPPMVLWAYEVSAATKKFGNVLATTSLYAAASSGGSPTTRFVAPTLAVEVTSDLQDVDFAVTRDCNSGEGTFKFRYYILIETAATS